MSAFDFIQQLITIVRYNLMMADGYRQVLDVYDISEFCNPKTIRTFEGTHGLATHVGAVIVVANETSLNGKAILHQDKQRVTSFRMKNGDFVKVREFVEDNFLWNSDFMEKIDATAKNAARSSDGKSL